MTVRAPKRVQVHPRRASRCPPHLRPGSERERKGVKPEGRRRSPPWGRSSCGPVPHRRPAVGRWRSSSSRIRRPAGSTTSWTGRAAAPGEGVSSVRSTGHDAALAPRTARARAADRTGSGSGPCGGTDRPNGPTHDFRTPPGGGPGYSDRPPRAVSAVASDDSGDRSFRALRPAPTTRQPIPPGADQDSHTTPTYGLVESTVVEGTPVGFREAERHPCVGRRYGRILPPSALSGARRVRNPDRCP